MRELLDKKDALKIYALYCSKINDNKAILDYSTTICILRMKHYRIEQHYQAIMGIISGYLPPPRFSVEDSKRFGQYEDRNNVIKNTYANEKRWMESFREGAEAYKELTEAAYGKARGYEALIKKNTQSNRQAYYSNEPKKSPEPPSFTSSTIKEEPVIIKETPKKQLSGRESALAMVEKLRNDRIEDKRNRAKLRVQSFDLKNVEIPPTVKPHPFFQGLTNKQVVTNDIEVDYKLKEACSGF